MKRSFLLTFLLLCQLYGDSTTAQFGSLKFGHEMSSGRQLVKDIYRVWNILLKQPDLGIKEALLQTEEREIIEKLTLISSKLSTLEQQVSSIAYTTIETILQAFPKIVRLELRLNELSSIVAQINFAEKQMRKYLNHGYRNWTKYKLDTVRYMNEYEQSLKENYTDGKRSTEHIEVDGFESSLGDVPAIEKQTMVDFALWATKHDYGSVLSLLNRLKELVAPKENFQDLGIFDLIEQVSKEIKSNLCNLRQSVHQTLYNLYNTVALAELKGNILLQFSYILLKMYDKGNFTVEARLAQSMYEENAEETIKVARNTLVEADRTIYRCDPKQYVEGVTYIKLTKLLQAYIENEVNLNPYGTCMENCAYYSYTQYNGCFKNKFCANQPQCRGKVMECRYVDSDMNICISSDPEKRYDWIEYENGKILGNKGVCEKKNFFKVDSWWRYLFWHCSYCLCLCDENVNSDRYFNRRDVTSDIINNKIVTGIRIVKHNRIIHLQIQQGILEMRGLVNQTSLSWKPVDNYTIDDDNVENDVDYHTMTRFERAIDMDEVFAPSEYVVTGVRFRKVGTHLNLEVRVTPINFETGQLLKIDYSYWMGNDNTDASLKDPRTEIKLENPDIPIRHGPHSSISKHNQYVLFQASSFDTDAGQSTVPFLDSQALTSKGFPISGVGLIHRGKVGSGGFIAPKLVSYDFTPHLNF